MTRILIKLAITFILFGIMTTEGYSECKNMFQYYFFFDYSRTANCGAKSPSCDGGMLESFITNVQVLGLSDNFTFITKTKKKKEFELFVANMKFKKIINDTSNQFTKFIDGKTLPALIVVNNEGIISFIQENLSKNPINFNRLLNNFKCLDLDKYESYNLTDSTINLYRPSPPQLDLQKEHFLILDHFDNKIKEFNINTGKIKRIIEVDSNLNYYSLKDTLDNFSILKPLNKTLSQFYSANYDKSNNIIVSASAVKGFVKDTLTVKIENKDTTMNITKKNMELLTLQFYDNIHFNTIDFIDSIYIFSLLNTQNGLLSTIKYNRGSHFNDLNSGNYYLIALLDSINFKPLKFYLNYKDIIKYYNLKSYLGSNGLIAKTMQNKYIYLNPWNGIFCIFKDSIENSIQIQGYLEKLNKSKSDTSFKSLMTNSGISRYSINSLNCYKNKAIVYIQSLDTDKQTPYTIIQVYDLKSGLEKEIILSSPTTKFFYSYILKIEDDFIYILSQNESEEWKIIKVSTVDVLQI